MILRHRFAIPLPRFVKDRSVPRTRQRDTAETLRLIPESAALPLISSSFSRSSSSSASPQSSSLLSSLLPLLFQFSFPSSFSSLLLSLIFLAVPPRGSTDLKSHLHRRKLHKNFLLQPPATIFVVSYLVISCQRRKCRFRHDVKCRLY